MRVRVDIEVTSGEEVAVFHERVDRGEDVERLMDILLTCLGLEDRLRDYVGSMVPEEKTPP